MTEPSAPTNPTAGAGAAPVGPDSRPATANGDWTDQVTDLIVDTVDKVRSKTTGPILEFSKGIVYAIVAMILGLPILVLAMVGLVRLVTIFIPAWAAYLLFGIIFVLIGVVMWSKRGRVPV